MTFSQHKNEEQIEATDNNNNNGGGEEVKDWYTEIMKHCLDGACGKVLSSNRENGGFIKKWHNFHSTFDCKSFFGLCRTKKSEVSIRHKRQHKVLFLPYGCQQFRSSFGFNANRLKCGETEMQSQLPNCKCNFLTQTFDYETNHLFLYNNKTSGTPL